MSRGAVAGGTVTVGAAPLALVTSGELLGARDRLVLPPESPGAVMRSCSRVMACRGSSSSDDEAVAGLDELSSPAFVFGSDTRIAELSPSSKK